MQSQSVQADSSLCTSFTVGFAMHRLMRELFVQTLMISTSGTIFSKRHFEIFFSFFQENIICTSCKLSPLHETSNPVFLVGLFVLRFYGPVNPMGSCRARSVYLTTRLLGRLSPLSG